MGLSFESKRLCHKRYIRDIIQPQCRMNRRKETKRCVTLETSSYSQNWTSFKRPCLNISIGNHSVRISLRADKRLSLMHSIWSLQESKDPWVLLATRWPGNLLPTFPFTSSVLKRENRPWWGKLVLSMLPLSYLDLPEKFPQWEAN